MARRYHVGITSVLRRWAGLMGILALASCGAGNGVGAIGSGMNGPEMRGPSAMAPTRAEPAGEVILASNGLLVAETGLEVGFGRTQASTTAAVTRLLGLGPLPDQTRLVPDCGTVQAWEGGLVLTFVQGDFRGWRVPKDTDLRRVEAIRPDVTGGYRAGRVCG